MVNISAAPRDLLQILAAFVLARQYAVRATCSAAMLATMPTHSVATQQQTQTPQRHFANRWDRGAPLEKYRDQPFAEANAAKEFVTEIIVPSVISQTQIHVR